MASAKLANSHPHHPLYHQHTLLHPHFHHLSIIRPHGPPATGKMTLDYSMPNSSRTSDSDQSIQSDLPSLIATDTRPNSNQSDDAFSNTADALSPLRSSSPTSSDIRDFQGSVETPTKKNKRKSSEPKRRSDAKVPRLSHDRADEATENQMAEKRTRNGDVVIDDSQISVHSNSSCRPSSSSSSRSSSHSSSKKKSPSPDPNQPSHLPVSFSPTSSSSHLSRANSPSTSREQEKDSFSPVLLNGMSQSFLHPFFGGVPPAAFGLVPGLYFGGQTLLRPPLPSPFPSAIPLHLQQNYIAAAAASAAAAHTGTTSSTASSSTFLNGSLSSQLSQSVKSESSPYLARPTSSHSHSHPVILKPPQPQVSSHKASAVSIPSQDSSLLQTPFPPSSQYRPGSRSTRSVTDNHNDDDDDDSSQVHSPEDLTLGGKMSRKQRKNYKNMTRERRVEANARERTRVHTISAAFDALRRAVPSYSYNQKLSKLAILRIACSYIMSLARLADLDYTSHSEHIQKPLTFAECVDMCTNTIQTEGRARRRH